MKLIIWALFAVAPVALVLGNNGKSSVYKSLSVPSSVIDGVTSESMNTINEVLCVLKSKGSLFCFKEETGVCTSYDKRLPSNYEAVNDDNPKMSCYTNETEGCRDGNQYLLEGESQVENNYEVTCINKILIKRCIDTNQFVLEGETLIEDKYEVTCLNKLLIKRCVDGNLDILEGDTLREATFEVTCSNKILIKKCIYNNQTYSEGSTRTENCYTMTCTQLVWTQAWIGSTPNFITVNGAGSIAYFYIYRPFGEAKQCCIDLGARLVIPDDFEALKQYMLSNTYTSSTSSSYYYWVGIVNQIWMDGSSVDANAWYSSEPDVGEDCAVMRPYYQGLLIGRICANAYTYSFICQKV